MCDCLLLCRGYHGHTARISLTILCCLFLDEIGALVEGNTFLHNGVLNQEVSFLQSWLEGPTHVYDVTIRNNIYQNCTAVHGGPLSAQPGSFFSLCGPPNCWNNTQYGNVAQPSGMQQQ